MNNDEIWLSFLNNISTKVSTMSYNTWFKDIKLAEINNDKAIIITPHKLIKNHIETNYIEIIEEIFENLLKKQLDVSIYTLEDYEKEKLFVDKINKPDNFVDNEEVINKKNISNLKDIYSFDNFIVGDTNKFAYLASVSVAEKPGKLYNPLFIYGNSGLGKTHLMHAIGNYCEKNNNNNVLYVSSEDFINDFINASRKNKKNETDLDYIEFFKKKYRNIDVLMIDDIQFLGSASKSQQEFTNTFNSLYQNEKQIIICSDRSVDDLKLMENRLKTRFNWGLTVNIYPPDFDLKVEIIKKKIKSSEYQLNLNEDVIIFIANNCGNDVRNLEGALNRLLAYSATWNHGVNISLEFAMDALTDYTNNMLYTQNSIEKVQRAVSDYYKINVEDMKSKKRSNNIAFPRQVAMYMSRLLTEETYPKIGLEFGGRDHSTVIFAYEKINKDLKTNHQLNSIINEIKNNIL